MIHEFVRRKRILSFVLLIGTGVLLVWSLAFISLCNTSEVLILRLRVQSERPIASRLLIPDFVVSAYWHLLGENRLQSAAENDPSFIKGATGVWIEAHADDSMDYKAANQLLATYLCAISATPEGYSKFQHLISQYPAQEKWRLQVAACAKAPAE